MSTRDNIDESELLARISAELDASVETLDTATQFRLRQVRREALQPRGRSNAWQPTLVPAGVFAAALAMLVLFGPLGRQPNSEPGFDDLEMLSVMEMELLDELEFYAWLDEVAG